MTWAIGEPGRPVRLFIDTSEDTAAAQVRDGERSVAVDAAIGGLAIQADGSVAAYVRPAPPLNELKAAKGERVAQAFDARIQAGLPVQGLHVQIDDGSRGNLLSLVTMAGLVREGLATWPTDYARGWVTAEGPRIPLATPSDGVQLALAASGYYSGLVQHAQDLVDEITAATDEAELDAVDIADGWPG